MLSMELKPGYLTIRRDHGTYDSAKISETQNS